jgi:hypothetical protein
MEINCWRGQGLYAETACRANQCPVPFAKIFRFTRRANHLYKFAPSHPTEGRIAIVTDAGCGCGGRGSFRRAMGSQGGLAKGL